MLGMLGLPASASANSGTPLMWAGLLHLAFGNALIGLLEGFLLGRFFALPYARTIGTMIAANYASAWIGGLFIRGGLVHLLPLNLNNAWMWFWVMVVVTYAMTLLIEWPFVAWCFRGQVARLRRSLKASLVIQTASYVLLFGWYWGASGVSLYTRMHVVAPTDLSLPESVLVYFIAPTDGDVYERQLVGGKDRKVFDLASTDDDDRLVVRRSASDTNRWELVARLESEDSRNPRLIPVLTNLEIEAAPDWYSTHTDPPSYKGTWFSFGEVQGFGSLTNSPWKFRTGFWPIEGLRAANKATGERVQFAYETPFGQWAVRNAVHLPTDQVLFQLGADQICTFDPVTRRVALLWRGRGPVAVIPHTALPARTNAPADPY